MYIILYVCVSLLRYFIFSINNDTFKSEVYMMGTTVHTNVFNWRQRNSIILLIACEEFLYTPFCAPVVRREGTPFFFFSHNPLHIIFLTRLLSHSPIHILGLCLPYISYIIVRWADNRPLFLTYNIRLKLISDRKR